MHTRIIPILVAASVYAAACDVDPRVPDRPGSEEYRVDRPEVQRPPNERRDGDAPRDNDNTAVNERDRATGALSPADQSNSEADIRITADIRKKVLGAAHLSTNADNVKIITKEGVVTLRGVVDSPEEKDSVEILAKQVDGVVRVDNQIELNLQ